MLCLIISNFATNMRNLFCHITLILFVILVACTAEKENEFRVTCTFDGITTDSVTLFVIEDDYNMMREASAASKLNGKVTLTGQIDAPAIAFLKIERVEKPFYFILEPGNTNLHFGREYTLAEGGALNHAYATYDRLRENIRAEREQNRKEYMKHVADSTLTLALERKMQKADSVLCDSVQRVTVEIINEGGPVGRLVREQYASSLDSLYKSKIK